MAAEPATNPIARNRRHVLGLHLLGADRTGYMG
jgi:hypothetical protein